MKGWDQLRKERLERQIDIGLFEKDIVLSDRDNRVRPWSEVSEEQKILSDYRMAVYAAQIYAVDYNVGKLVKYLKETNQFDNTLIMFLSDNGACAEPYHESEVDNSLKSTILKNPVLFLMVLAGLILSNTPFRL